MDRYKDRAYLPIDFFILITASLLIAMSFLVDALFLFWIWQDFMQSQLDGGVNEIIGFVISIVIRNVLMFCTLIFFILKKYEHTILSASVIALRGAVVGLIGFPIQIIGLEADMPILYEISANIVLSIIPIMFIGIVIIYMIFPLYRKTLVAVFIGTLLFQFILIGFIQGYDIQYSGFLVMFENYGGIFYQVFTKIFFLNSSITNLLLDYGISGFVFLDFLLSISLLLPIILLAMLLIRGACLVNSVESHADMVEV